MTVQLIQSYYRAFNGRDYTGMLALVSDDVVHDINEGGREVGRDRFATFLAAMDAAYSEQVDELVVLGNGAGRRFAAEFTVIGRYLRSQPGLPSATGQRYRLPAGAFFTVDENKISRVSTYYNLQAWIRQVGG